MRALKPKRSFNWSGLFARTPVLGFSPVESEDDELIQAIEQSAQESHWTLSSYPDPGELENFWSRVQQDMHSDPNWVSFSEDDSSQF